MPLTTRVFSWLAERVSAGPACGEYLCINLRAEAVFTVVVCPTGMLLVWSARMNVRDGLDLVNGVSGTCAVPLPLDDVDISLRLEKVTSSQE